MKKILYHLAVLLACTVSAQSGEKNFIDQNYIEVTGSSEMQVAPNLIYLSIFLSEKDSKNKVSVADQEHQMITVLKELGIDPEQDLKVHDMFSNYYKHYGMGGQDVILSRSYELLVHDARTAMQVFTELEKVDISNVTVDRLDHTEIVAYRRLVKVDAVKAAKDKASALAEAIGQQIGRALYIQEPEEWMLGAPGAANSVEIRGRLSSSFEAEQPEVDFEIIRLSYRVRCRFELK